MRVSTIIDEDFTNYKVPAMFIGTISCGGKCCAEADIPLSVCQNDGWRSCAPITLPDKQICERYLSNPLTSAVVFGGLEPFEQTEDIYYLIRMLRDEFCCDDDIIVYTGYNRDEIEEQLRGFSKYKNIIIKFGRFVPNQNPHYDEVLGVELASNNQYAEKIS